MNNKKPQRMIEIVNLNKWFGEFHVLKDINLTIRDGEKLVICGPSGSSKLSGCASRPQSAATWP